MRTRGFTLVELLVAVAVVAVLVAALLPAVRSAREAGRRLRYAGNLRQIGLGLNGYLNTHDSFPAGRVFVPDYDDYDPRSPCSSLLTDRSFLVSVLPYVGERNVAHVRNLVTRHFLRRGRSVEIRADRSLRHR